jgi:non-specific serine/threonine protein kinase/serine/threonine-protein kinase
MTAPEDQARSLFLDALEREPNRWPEFLDAACGGDADLRARVEQLLDAHRAMGSIHVESPVGPNLTIDEPAVTEGAGTVGPYKLLEPIGEGGFGVVFLAEQSQPVRRKVALKLLKPGMDTRQVVARFEVERQALAIMDHPNIAKVLDGGATPSGRPYFVMELVKGTPVTEFCDQNHLTPRQRLELFVPVCHAVQHAHQKGIIHRDLKPSNVLVSRHDTTPVVKVIDFGVAKALGQTLTDKTLFTAFTQMIGTPQYMSPEQAGMSDQDVDTRSDVYSLGVLLYELLTGTTPFTRERFRRAECDEIRRIIREEEPPKPSTRLSESKDALPSISAHRHTEPAQLTRLVRGELDWIVMKCLEKDRNRRYESANGLALDVQRHLADEPVLACPPSAGYRVKKFLRKHRAVVIPTVVIVIACVVAAIGQTINNVRANRAEAKARTERDRAVEAEQLAQERLQQITAEKQRADAERAVARAVNDFLLKDLLEQAGPEKRLDPDLKLRTVLDRAAEKVSGRFARQPHVEAAVRATIGNTYLRLGLLTDALPHLERAAELYRPLAAAKESDSEFIAIQLVLAAIYKARGEVEKFRRTMSSLEEILSALPPDVRSSPENVEYATFQALRADNLPKQAWKSAEKFFEWADDSDPEMKAWALVFRTLASGKSLVDAGHLAEAEKMLTDGITAVQALRGKPDQVGMLRLLLAHVYMKQGQAAAAERQLTEAIAACRAVGGDDSLLPGLYQSLGRCLLQQGRPAEAEAAFRQTMEVLLRTKDPRSAVLAAPLADLASAEVGQGKAAAAERTLRQALAILDRQAPDAPGRFQVMIQLGGVLDDEHKPADAEPLLRQGYLGLTASRAPAGADEWRHRAEAARRLARLCEATDRTAEAAQFWDDLWAIADAPPPAK